MKKLLITLLALCLLASFTACDSDAENEESNSQTAFADDNITDSETEASESQSELEEDDRFIDETEEVESQTEADRWTNNY